MMSKIATFAAGCFWGVEASFRKLKGVVNTRVGYTGGHYSNPTYKDVCSHKTGHAEAVEIIFNPEQISYEELLDHFFKNHDPTTLDRQGPDIGSQYRSAIFYHDEEQKKIALKVREKYDGSGMFLKPIVTEIVEAREFWVAEEYHQQYIEKRKKKTFNFKSH